MLSQRAKAIRDFILDTVPNNPSQIGRLTRQQFGLTRQVVNRHLAELVNRGELEETARRSYRLKVLSRKVAFSLSDHSDEEETWRLHIADLFLGLPENIQRICYYGFTEMYNNAVDHSTGSKIDVEVIVEPRRVLLALDDDGIGIFEKIRSFLGFEDHHQAILELSKGKLTTDPRRHTGQGIFFTSRMFDMFALRANNLAYIHSVGITNDWMIQMERNEKGTGVIMEIRKESERTTREVFDRYSSDDENYLFCRTHVPLSLANYGGDQLVSRSQAKRILARFEQFEEVLLDFKGVEEIGQAFADEIFRVYHFSHPKVRIIPLNVSPYVDRMIRRAMAGRDESAPSE
ncbi:STAS-like domain-containing protein [Tautonia rosea]|uniref:STAS-like domain-containing protein n=1 Tax=Tautonia rosea TaxID=2728037 RepID=UPI0014730584|nr:DUF4325 domain-containing protein [Tautonia rosea]